MNLWDIIKEFMNANGGWIAIAAVILLSFVEVSKIKLNPWSAILRWIGKKINSEIKDDIKEFKEEVNSRFDTVDNDIREVDKKAEKTAIEMQTLQDKVTSNEDKLEEYEMKSARYRIVRFSDECAHGDLHSREHYDQIMLDCDQYENYCDLHPGFKNNLAVQSIKHIRSRFEVHLEKNDFLK